MAHLKSQTFQRANKAGEQLVFNSTVTVDSDGIFAWTIPDELAESAEKMARARPSSAPCVRVWKPKTHWRVTCATLDGGDGFIRAAMDDYLAVEIHTERVIVYAHDCKVCYSEALDGSLHPNGYFAEKEPGKAKHGGKLHATEHSRYFCVGIFARVYDRVTYIRPASQKIELKRVGFDIYDKSPAARLNAFIGLSLDANERTPYMPYTDEAADFFTNMMTGMCELARKLDDFLGDREKLELAISRQALLLGAPAA